MTAGNLARSARVSIVGPALLVVGSLLGGCASETAAHHQRRAEEHVYIGPRRSFLERAARLLAEKGQSPQQIAPDTLQTRWTLISGGSTDPRQGAQPLVFQSYRVRVTSLDDLHHHVRIERGTVTTFQAPTRTEMPASSTSGSLTTPGTESGLPAIDPPVSSGVPVFVPDGELEWELLRRTDPAAAAEVDQERAGGPGR
jgi:hypothetical protein